MILRSIIDFIFPRYCEMCDTRLQVEENFICPKCYEALPRTYMWKKIPRTEKYRPDDNLFSEITQPTKEVDVPLSDDVFNKNELAAMYLGKIDVERAISFLKYMPKTNTAKLIYGFKYHHKRNIALALGKIMAEEIMESGFFNGIDYLIPIPLTYYRLCKRGYNQSTELARGICSITRIPVEEHAIKRKHFSTSQTKLDILRRQENIAGAFALDKNSKSLIGKHILLIDDIITTGATTIECCSVLKQIQGIKISILSLGIVKSI